MVATSRSPRNTHAVMHMGGSRVMDMHTNDRGA